MQNQTESEKLQQFQSFQKCFNPHQDKKQKTQKYSLKYVNGKPLMELGVSEINRLSSQQLLNGIDMILLSHCSVNGSSESDAIDQYFWQDFHNCVIGESHPCQLLCIRRPQGFQTYRLAIFPSCPTFSMVDFPGYWTQAVQEAN